MQLTEQGIPIASNTILILPRIRQLQNDDLSLLSEPEDMLYSSIF